MTEKTLKFSLFRFILVSETSWSPPFFLGYFHFSILFCFVRMFLSAVKFYLILFLAMAESKLPTTGEELDLNNEIRVTGERKQ